MPRQIDPAAVAAALLDVEAGTPVAAAALAHGISASTIDRRRGTFRSSKDRILGELVVGAADDLTAVEREYMAFARASDDRPGRGEPDASAQ